MPVRFALQFILYLSISSNTKSGALDKALLSLMPESFPRILSTFFGGSHNPEFTSPTFLPEPPNPIFLSISVTESLFSAADNAAEQPV